MKSPNRRVRSRAAMTGSVSMMFSARSRHRVVSSARLQQLAADLAKHYAAAQADLKNGDLAGYAAEMQQVNNDAAQIAGSGSPSPGPSPKPSP